MTHENLVGSLQAVATTYDALPIPVLLVDTGSQIRFVNWQAVSTLGYERTELLGDSVYRIVPDHLRPHIEQVVQRSLDADEPSTVSNHLVASLIHSSGNEIAADVIVTAINTDGERLLLFTCLERVRTLGEHLHDSSGPRTTDQSQGTARVGSWQWDIESDAVTWSPELCRIFGVSPDNPPISFEQYRSFIHPDDRRFTKETIEEAFARRESFDMEHRIIRPDGAVRVIYGQGAANIDEHGNLRSMIGTAQDITERKVQEEQQFQLALEQAARQEAERSKDRFQFLAELSQVLNASLDYDDTLDQFVHLLIPRLADWCSINTFEQTGTINRLAVAHRNPEKQRILESVRARGFLPHGDETHPLTRTMQTGEPEVVTNVTDELLQRMARNQEHLDMMRRLEPTSFMMVPLFARGRAFGVVTFGMDDSGRRYADEDLQLAVEVTHRASVSIDNAKLFREAQQVAMIREEFVSLVSHELKTPLTVIKGNMQVLERHMDQQQWDYERIHSARQRLSTQVERLEVLVSDILDVSRVQQGRLELRFEPDTDIVDLAHQVVERFDDAIERTPDHTIHVYADGPVPGRWDAMRLDQVFSNLISNALKYSPDGGPVELRIRAQDDRAIVEVRDNGIGISPEEQQNLFQPFRRGSVATRSITGTGLGLHISQQIVKQHGGEITVESEPDSYTIFRIELPFDPDASDQPVSDPAS